MAFSSEHGVVAARDTELLMAVAALLGQAHVPTEADLFDIVMWDYDLDPEVGAGEDLTASADARHGDQREQP